MGSLARVLVLLQWDYPEGANVLAEYWLETEAPRVVAVMEAENMDVFG